jgi:hypothetical protein
MRDAFIADAKGGRMYQPRPMPVPELAKRVASQTSHSPPATDRNPMIHQPAHNLGCPE